MQEGQLWGHFVSVRVFFFLFSSALKGPVRSAFISSSSALVFFFGSRLHQHLHLLLFLWGLFWHFLYFSFFSFIISLHKIIISSLFCTNACHARLAYAFRSYFALLDYFNLWLLSKIQVFNLLCACVVFFFTMLNVYERLMRKTMQRGVWRFCWNFEE
jgi:uncharacterized membrane protein